MIKVLTSPEFISGVTQFITALTALVAAIASMVAMMRSKENGRKIEAVQAIADATHDSTNSRMDQLVHEVREASIAKGAKQEADRALLAAVK